MRAFALLLAATAALAAMARAHSFMTIPQGFSPRDCKVGGFVRSNCRGPCDLTYIKRARYNGPNNPAATYRRGQKVRIAYNRNNRTFGRGPAFLASCLSGVWRLAFGAGECALCAARLGWYAS